MLYLLKSNLYWDWGNINNAILLNKNKKTVCLYSLTFIEVISCLFKELKFKLRMSE